MIKPIALISFTVEGYPEPRGSKTSHVLYEKGCGPIFKNGRVIRQGVPVFKDGRVVTYTRDDNDKSGPWMEVVKRAGRIAMLRENHRELFNGCLTLQCIFYFERPKFHFNKAGQVRPGMPAFPNVKPDASKCLRAIEDSLSGNVIHDDARLATSAGHKRYCKPGDPERVEILVCRLPSTVQEMAAWSSPKLFQEA